MATTAPPYPGVDNPNLQPTGQYPPPVQQTYPPPAQQTYPPPVQQAYPPPGQQAYPPPVQQAYPPPVQQAYPPTGQQAYPPPGLQPPPYSDVSTEHQKYPGYINDANSDIVDIEGGPSDDGVGVIAGFDDKSIRRGFIRKVFAILGCQMMVTVGLTALFMFHQPTNEYVKDNISIYIAAYCVFFVLYFVLSCCTNVARKHPTNLILLFLFTLSLGYMVAVISAYHDTYIVLCAFGMTIFCTLGVMIFATQTKVDVTACSGVLFCCATSLILFGIFAGALVPNGYMSIARVAYSALGALLYMGFLAFDIQLIMGGRKYELSPEEYVFAAVQLYVDVIYIFLFILRIFGGSK